MPGVKGKSGGHNRKLTREKELLGAATRRLTPDAPDPITDVALAIEFGDLGPAGRSFYDSRLAALTNTGFMGTNETLGLYLMARTFEDWAEADAMIRKVKRWRVKRDAEGNVEEVKVSAFHRIENDLWERLLKIQREYGQTPLSREGVRRLARGDDGNEFKDVTK